jgi:hypothetical protein
MFSNKILTTGICAVICDKAYNKLKNSVKAYDKFKNSEPRAW